MIRYNRFLRKIGEVKVLADTIKETNKLSLFHLTWPIFLEVFLFMLMGLADTFMLSALSDNAVSGVVPIKYIHIAILILEVVGNGASIVVSQYLGSKRFLKRPRSRR